MNLPPTAQRLLEGARRLFEKSGYSSLTLDGIAKEAGETKSLIRYHFGSKQGLLVALVDWVMHEYTMAQSQLISELPEGDARVRGLADSLLSMMRDTSSYRIYFDLMSQLLRDPKMQARAAAQISTWRHLTASVLLSTPAHGVPKEVMTLASMTIALADGLALQLLADPNGVDVDQAMSLWDACLKDVLSSVEQESRS